MVVGVVVTVVVGVVVTVVVGVRVVVIVVVGVVVGVVVSVVVSVVVGAEKNNRTIDVLLAYYDVNMSFYNKIIHSYLSINLFAFLIMHNVNQENRRQHYRGFPACLGLIDEIQNLEFLFIIFMSCAIVQYAFLKYGGHKGRGRASSWVRQNITQTDKYMDNVDTYISCVKEMYK